MQKTIEGLGLFIAAALATVASILVLDRPAARFAHDAFQGSIALFVALTHIVDPVLPIAGAGFLLIGGAMLFGWRTPRPLHVLFCLCAASLIAVAIKDQLKYAFGRTWPETWIMDNPSFIRDGVSGFTPFHGGQGWASFPSGHTTLATAPTAVLILMLQGRWRWLAIVPPLLVAVGLYGADYHFVGDILGGAMVGALSAAIVVQAIGRRTGEGTR